MSYIVSYQKHITTEITRELRLPEGAEQHERIGTELATVDGVTYVALPDGAVLPANQPEEIAASIVNPAVLTDAVRDTIKAASPHVRLINQRVIERIRAVYSIDDEIKCLRLAPSADTTAYNDYVEDCRAWGREQKAALGM